MNIIAFFSTALLAALISPIVIWLYRKQHWVDDPTESKHVKRVHTTPTPRGGGLVVFISLLVAALIFLEFDPQLEAIFAGGLLLTIVGFIDDIYDIHPFWRLGAGLVASVLVVLAGIGISYVTNPFGPGVIHVTEPSILLHFGDYIFRYRLLADSFAILFIVWNMNIVNWSKGIDGQMPGFVSIALVFVGLLSYRFIDDPAQFSTALLAFSAAGAFAGLLLWNMYPQKIMPGYGAGSLAGFFLSVLAILSGAKVATTLMVLAIPTADAVFAITRRIIAGKSPWWGDRGHMHHKLMDVLGWDKRSIALFYWVSSLIMGVLSLYLNTTGKIVTIALVSAAVFGFMIWAKLHTLKKV